MIALGEVKAWLEITTADEDSLLTNLEARAVETLQRELGRYFGSAKEFVERFEGRGSDELYLSENPGSLTSVEERDHPGDAWTAIAEGDDDGWELETGDDNADGAVVFRKGGNVWEIGREYRVTYTFGYVSGEEPGDIRQEVLNLVSAAYLRRGRDGLRSERIGDYSYQFDGGDTTSGGVSTDVSERWRHVGVDVA